MPRRYIWFDHQSNIIIGLMMKFRSLVLQTIIPWLCWAWTLHEPPRYWSGTTSPQPLLSARESRTGHVDVDIRMVNDGSIRRRLFWGLYVGDEGDKWPDGSDVCLFFLLQLFPLEKRNEGLTVVHVCGDHRDSVVPIWCPFATSFVMVGDMITVSDFDDGNHT